MSLAVRGIFAIWIHAGFRFLSAVIRNEIFAQRFHALISFESVWGAILLVCRARWPMCRARAAHVPRQAARVPGIPEGSSEGAQAPKVLLLGPSQWVMACPGTDDDLRRMAVAVYVVYRVTHHVRHNRGVTQEYIRHFMNQLLHEAVRGNSALRSCCGSGASGDVRRGQRRRRSQ